MTKIKVVRSSVTGKFVRHDKAKTNPKQTETETYKVSHKRSKR